MFGIEISIKTIFIIIGLAIGGTIFFKIVGVLMKAIGWVIGKIIVFLCAILMVIYVIGVLHVYVSPYYPEPEQKLINIVRDQYEKGIKITDDNKLDLNHTVNHIVETTQDLGEKGVEAVKNLKWE